MRRETLTYNSLTAPLVTELKAALAQVRDEREVRVVILAGAGKGFSSGANLGGAKSQAYTLGALGPAEVHVLRRADRPGTQEDGVGTQLLDDVVGLDHHLVWALQPTCSAEKAHALALEELGD